MYGRSELAGDYPRGLGRTAPRTRTPAFLGWVLVWASGGTNDTAQ
ncbi:hypothetical protein [Streptomyces sp. NPDC001135]